MLKVHVLWSTARIAGVGLPSNKQFCQRTPTLEAKRDHDHCYRDSKRSSIAHVEEVGTNIGESRRELAQKKKDTQHQEKRL